MDQYIISVSIGTGVCYQLSTLYVCILYKDNIQVSSDDVCMICIILYIVNYIVYKRWGYSPHPPILKR